MALAPLLLGGCGTIASIVLAGSGAGLAFPPGSARRAWPLGAVYCGVALDVYLMQRGTPTGGVLGALDLPLSFGLDTLLLPLTVPLQVAWWLSRPAASGPAPPRADVAPVSSR
ncbi:MAG: YceK/YidQ family lipoprotein [Planctomycetes bacterium]|nr:YceK/YidQ family lipoprotein [Planctomycetota bacterium]